MPSGASAMDEDIEMQAYNNNDAREHPNDLSEDLDHFSFGQSHDEYDINCSQTELGAEFQDNAGSGTSSLFPSMGRIPTYNIDNDVDGVGSIGVDEKKRSAPTQIRILNTGSSISNVEAETSDWEERVRHTRGEYVEATDTETIRSSVLHRILDNESLDAGTSHDKLYYSRKYEKYNNNRSRSTPNLDFMDFETYDKILNREDKLRGKLDIIAKRKGKSLPGTKAKHPSNVLTTLNEGELNDMFVSPEVAAANAELDEKGKRSGRKVLRSTLLNAGNLLKALHSNGSSNHERAKDYRRQLQKERLRQKEKEEKDSTYGDYVSTFSSIPIDDDIGIEDLPIDSQPFRKIYDSPSPGDGSYNPQSLDIDMVVSSQEKLDYNLHPIDEYGANDPAEDANCTKSWFKRMLDHINIMRMIRIQRANKYQIQRKLNVRHLHQIALGGTLGVGLLLSSGKAFAIAGPLGCLLGFMLGGFLVIATMLSFCEIVTLIPLCGGVSGIASRFVDDAFGFSLGVIYWITYMISLPTEITAGAIMLSFYSNLDIPGPKTAGWITLFFFFTLFLNLFDIRVYGEFEYYSTIVKLLILLAMMIYMIVLNRGGSGPYHEVIGFRYWDSSLSDLNNMITFGPFRPTFDVNDRGLGSLDGIGGNLGRFLQVIIASVTASYAYVGTEIVILAGSESRNPRQAIPTATKNIYLRVVVFYLLAIFLVGLNIYSGDPRLLRYFSKENDDKSTSESLAEIAAEANVIELTGGHCQSDIIHWAGFSNGNQSPWVIAIQSAGLCSFAGVVNAFLLYFALTAASSQLYASSRTLYFMSIQNKAPSIFSLCTKRGVPYMSVLFTGSFGMLSYLSVQNDTALIFERLVGVCSTAGLLVWSGMCFSFIRFYYALKLRPDIISRNDEDYPYRSPFQPYLAYIGMILSLFLVFASGFVVFLKDDWSPVFFISSYGCLILFVVCYIGYRLFRRTKVQRLDQVDLDSGRREIDRVIWEDERNYTSNFKEILTKGINLLV